MKGLELENSGAIADARVFSFWFSFWFSLSLASFSRYRTKFRYRTKLQMLKIGTPYYAEQSKKRPRPEALDGRMQMNEIDVYFVGSTGMILPDLSKVRGSMQT